MCLVIPVDQSSLNIYLCRPLSLICIIYLELNIHRSFGKMLFVEYLLLSGFTSAKII